VGDVALLILIAKPIFVSSLDLPANSRKILVVLFLEKVKKILPPDFVSDLKIN